jgi:hypothetical protein
MPSLKALGQQQQQPQPKILTVMDFGEGDCY